MKLLTKEIEARFAALGDQADSPDPVVVAKFFNPYGAGTWYATSYDPASRIFFGFAEILPGEGEWGTFSLDEMEAIVIEPFDGRIERDVNFQSRPFSKVRPKEAGR